MGRHNIRFPIEDPGYRSARDSWLEREIALRSRLEEVAAARSQLPIGGLIPADYEFSELDAGGSLWSVKLSELFGSQYRSLICGTTYNRDYHAEAEGVEPDSVVRRIVSKATGRPIPPSLDPSEPPRRKGFLAKIFGGAHPAPPPAWPS